MKSRLVLSLFCGACALLQLVEAQCDLSQAKDKKEPFPDIESLAIESYQMTVEYTAPGAKQSDYFMEYYDMIYRRGKVEMHAAGKSSQYMYKTASWEAWDISSESCKLQNITETPYIFKEAQHEWLYIPAGAPEKRTAGPSAMFKIAYDEWDSKSKDGKFAYMGKAEEQIRGINSHYWRRCDTDTSYVDYYFAIDDDEEDAFGAKKGKKIPLRVHFGGTRKGHAEELDKQHIEVIAFQPFISLNEAPFQLPKRRGCKRGYLENPPKVPDFSNNNLMFNAEVIYRKIDRSGDDVEYWSYYSTLMMALDIKNQHLAYFFTPWETKRKTTSEPEAKAPVYEVYDMKHHYLYKYNLDDGNCTIERTKTFVPKYTLPEGAGAISLTDPSILFPNNELTYISEGVNRGLKVNIFEEIVEGYLLDKNDKEQEAIPKATITHSYLQDNEIERNVAMVKNALAQVQLMFSGRKTDQFEILTINFFGFSTEIVERRSIFNVKRCFKNDDDYAWVTIGFNADPSTLQKVKNDVPAIQDNLLSSISLRSELNAVRIPIIQVDFKDDGLYASLLILSKPPVMLDYEEPVINKQVTGSSKVSGVEDEADCAKKCLETIDNCWGFSICGALCTFGSGADAKVVDIQIADKTECILYMRFDNNTYIPSKEKMIDNLRTEVEDNEVHLMLAGPNDERIQLDASSFQVTDPGEDDSLFDRIGNKLNSRMRVLKAGYRLSPASGGSPVKNMGRLRYDECQRICLDFQACETLSYCLTESECTLSLGYGDDILAANQIEENSMCNVLTRKYEDRFERSPGNVLSLTAQVELDAKDVDACARACLKETGFMCQSFDHCPSDKSTPCKLHTVHYPNPQTREKLTIKAPTCGHYFRKYSTEFSRNSEKRTVGSTLAPLTNLNLEECSKACVELRSSNCYGFDFCQDKSILQTTCTLLNSDPTKMKTAYSPICSSFQRIASAEDLTLIKDKRPYSNTYAGGIGFLCFLVGGLVGAGIVFGIAYFRVNRR